MIERIKHFIDIILGKNIIGKSPSDTSSNLRVKDTTIMISHHSYEIDDSIFSLLYFIDGKYKNIAPGLNEPSAISMKWSLSSHSAQKLNYYPSLSNATPAQRNAYLDWLAKNLPSDVDIGYFFILLNCIERHVISNNKLNESKTLLARLMSLTNNDSFKYYASTSIAYVYFQLNQKDIISIINLDKCIIDLKILIKQELSVDDIINCANKVGFTNKRYIKKYPDIFNKSLSKILVEKFGNPIFPCKFDNLDTMPKQELHFANISISQNIRAFFIPDPFSNKQFKDDIKNCLYQAHNQVKLFLKQERILNPKSNSKNNKIENNPSYSYVGATVKDKLPNHITSIKIKVLGKKRINIKTNHPVSTDKQILSSYTSLILLKNKPPEDPELLKYKDVDMLKQDILLDYILPRYENGLLFYRLGQWDEAEREWLKLIYLMPSAIDKLGILYRKEKRYYDIVLITKEATKSTTIPYLYNETFNNEDVAIAMNNYKKHKSSDVSCLSVNDFENIKRN